MASVNSTLCEEDEAVGLNLAKLRVFVAVVGTTSPERCSTCWVCAAKRSSGSWWPRPGRALAELPPPPGAVTPR